MGNLRGISRRLAGSILLLATKRQDSRLFGFDTGRDDDVMPFLEVGGDAVGELLRRAGWTSTPTLFIAATVSGSANNVFMAAFTLDTIAAGVPAGALMACQSTAS